MLRATLALLTLCGTQAFAQSVLTARAGLLHYAEGHVFLDDKIAEVDLATFPSMKSGSVLKTTEGRAEVLLNPGVFLRLGENTTIKLVDGRLDDARVELIEGTAVLESDWETVQQADAVTIIYKGTTVNPRKAGIYRFTTEPAAVRVYSGEAVVTRDGATLTVKGSREASLDAPMAASKFDSKQGDALTRWSKRRAEYIAMASVSSSKSLLDNGTRWNSGGWYFNPYFGMVTYIPGSGMYRTPYGYSLYAPSRIDNLYYRPVISAGSGSGFGQAPGMGSYRQAAQASGGYSGVISSGGDSGRSAAPAAAAAAAPAPAPAAAPISRDSGQGGGAR